MTASQCSHSPKCRPQPVQSQKAAIAALSKGDSPTEIICAYIVAKFRKGRDRDVIARKLDILEGQFPALATEFAMARESYKLHAAPPPPYMEKEKDAGAKSGPAVLSYNLSANRAATATGSRPAVKSRYVSPTKTTTSPTKTTTKTTPTKKTHLIGPGAPSGPVGHTWNLAHPSPPRNVGVIWEPAKPRPVPVGEMWNPQFGGRRK